MKNPQPSATAQRQAALETLLAAVQARPWAHDFFTLLRRLDALRPDAPRSGQTQRPSQELLRLAQQPEMDFAPAPLWALERRDGAPPRLAVRFFGLLGPQGALPLHLTEYVRDRLHQHGDAAPAHFLDLFHHRLLVLFYRAWAQSQPTVQADRPLDDRFLAWLGAAAGQTGGAGPLPASALAFNAGLLAGRSRHAEALCKVLRQHFQVPVALLPHVGHWLEIDPDDRSRLGRAPGRNGQALEHPARLGLSANAGSRVWDRQYRFRLQLGPLGWVKYQQFLPGGSAWTPLNAWVRRLAGSALRWDLELALAPAERPALRLGEERCLGPQLGPRLGVSTWLGRPSATQEGPRSPRPLRLRPGLSFLQRQQRS